MLIRQAVALLNTASETVESLRLKMNELASTLPEYPVVMDMNGVGSTLGPQLMAEIGDVTRFTHPRSPSPPLLVLTPERMIQDSMFRKACEPQKGVPLPTQSALSGHGQPY